MRLNFPNLTRPKKASKILANLLNRPLSRAQDAVSKICGYRDWHDLEQAHASLPPTPLDQTIPDKDYIDRQASLALSLADKLCIPDGDAQYALSYARLCGDRPTSLSEQIAIRLTCWHLTVIPAGGRRQKGEVGRIKYGNTMILRSFGQPTMGISHGSVACRADFEYRSPKAALPLFLPMRLYLPYGFWVEDDGAKVIFSRDYKPMWRARSGREPERLEPWLRIKFKEQVHLWDGVVGPWNSSNVRQRLEDFLAEQGVSGLPIWADALPILLHNDRLTVMSDAVGPLRDTREAMELASAA